MLCVSREGTLVSNPHGAFLEHFSMICVLHPELTPQYTGKRRGEKVRYEG